MSRSTRRLESLFIVVSIAALACSFATRLLGGDAPEPIGIETSAPELRETNAPPSDPISENSTDASTDAGALEILSVNGYLDSFGSWRVVGLIHNGSDRILDNVEVEVEIFDSEGKSVHMEYAFVSLFNLEPGAVAPFQLDVFENLPQADHFVATIVGSSPASINPVRVKVVNQTMTIDDDGDLHITGEIINPSERPVVINSVSAAVFDEQSQIITADTSSVFIQYLDRGQSGPFRISIFGSAPVAAAAQTFQVYVDAERSITTEPIALEFSEQFDYFDAFEFFHVVGEVTNTGPAPLNVTLIATIYDGNGAVLDAADLALPISSLAPGESTPYDFDSWGPLNYTGDLFRRAERVSVQVDPYWTWSEDAALIPLSATGTETVDYGEFEATIRGVVVNDSDVPVSDITVVAGLREVDTGRVIAMGYDNLFETLPASASAEYTVLIPVEPGLDPARVQHFLLARGER